MFPERSPSKPAASQQHPFDGDSETTKESDIRQVEAKATGKGLDEADGSSGDESSTEANAEVVEKESKEKEPQRKKTTSKRSASSSSSKTKAKKAKTVASKQDKSKDNRSAGAAKKKQKSLFDFFGVSKKSKSKIDDSKDQQECFGQEKTVTGGQGDKTEKTTDVDVDDDTEDSSLENKPPPGKKSRIHTDDESSSISEDDMKPSKAKPGASKKRAAPTRKKTVKKQNSNGTVVGYDKQPYTVGDDLPIISEPQLMFDDMVQRNLLEENDKGATMLLGLLKKLKSRPLRVATMCSGTESPVLALDMIQKSIRDVCRDHPDKFGTLASDKAGFDQIFQLEHVFSCEIEPYKQAYIERNFHPPLLFRDIRELGQEKAYTAYGALVDVPNQPGCVDILIAGTSCVDYSNLNTKKVSV